MGTIIIVCIWYPCMTVWRSERSERSHSQVIKIEICDIYMYSTYVRIYPPGAVAIGGWLQSGRSRVRSLLWNSGLFFFSLSLLFFFFPLLFPLSSLSPLPSLYLSPFLFPLHARSATSMLKHFSSYLIFCKTICFVYTCTCTIS